MNQSQPPKYSQQPQQAQPTNQQMPSNQQQPTGQPPSYSQSVVQSIKNSFSGFFGQKQQAKQVQHTAQPCYNDDPVAHTDLFKIVMVLDESGSMQPVQNSILESINGFITEQKQIKERPSAFTLVKFNDFTTRVIENESMDTVKLLHTENYVPDRSTALYDAIGSTINWFRNEKDVLLVIVTDGQENASTSFTKQQVLDLVKQKEEQCGWTYVYLSCDLAASQQGSNIGLTKSAYATNSVVDQSQFGAYISSNLNSAVKNYRKEGISVQSQLNSGS